MYRFARLILITAGVSMAQEGTRVYIAHCQQCHDQNSDAHAPLAEALASKPWEAILKSLETGAMRAQERYSHPKSVARWRAIWGKPDPPSSRR